MHSSLSATKQSNGGRNASHQTGFNDFSRQTYKGDIRDATAFRLNGRASGAASRFANGRVIRAGRRRKGTLKEADGLNNIRPGRFADHYRVKGVEAGQQVHIKLNSRMFDTYVQVLDRNTGRLLLDNDDQRAGVSNSRLTFIAQPGTEYGIKVTSFAEAEEGRYSLRVRAVQRQTAGFSYGNGLIDAAAAVEKAANLDSSPISAVNSASHSTNNQSESWNVNHINAPEAWEKGFKGQDVVVAVIDSGVSYTHRDLSQNIWNNPGEIPDNGVDDDGNGFVDDWQGWDFVQDDNKPGDPNGHGTHISGIIAGLHNDIGVSGIAPEASIMPVRVLDQNGSGNQRDVAKGIRYAVKNGADVINLSLGGPPQTELTRSLRKAIKFAYEQGVFVAIAAGNDRQGYGSTHSGEPAYWASSRGYAISVGAIDESLQVGSYSNPRGDKENAAYVVAPGSDVHSILPWYPTRTFSWSGTSFATPHVAAVAALMLSANPDLSPSELMGIITESANPEGLSVA